jgi:hypothetical protein
MNNTTNKTVTQKFGPLTRDEEVILNPWTQEEKHYASYFRPYHGFVLSKVGLGRVWYVSPAGTDARYPGQFRTAREAAAWIDSDMRLDWVQMWHGTVGDAS